jgi:hypothetical protein
MHIFRPLLSFGVFYVQEASVEILVVCGYIAEEQNLILLINSIFYARGWLFITNRYYFRLLISHDNPYQNSVNFCCRFATFSSSKFKVEFQNENYRLVGNESGERDPSRTVKALAHGGIVWRILRIWI